MKQISIENHIRQRAGRMSEFKMVAYLDREKVMKSGLAREVLRQMCRNEVSRQLQIRIERRDQMPKEKYVKGRYRELLELWRERDDMWRRCTVDYGSMTINYALKYMNIPGACLVVSGVLVVFDSDFLETFTGRIRKTRRKQTNRRLEFYMYDPRNHRRVHIATAPIARWTEKNVGTALYDTLAGLSPTWLVAMSMENIYKAEIRAKRLPPGRLPR